MAVAAIEKQQMMVVTVEKQQMVVLGVGHGVEAMEVPDGSAQG